MSEISFQTRSALGLSSASSVGDGSQNRVTSTTKGLVELPKLTSSTVHHHSKSRHVQKPQSHLRYWRLMRQMQCRLLLLVYLLLGLSLPILALGVVNWFTLHSLQEKVNNPTLLRRG